ncbi:uroporphyrinogen-III C-methyltransferase [Alteromonas sp. KUL49]|nr:uroporphyrinogen-III C-methyltransferase [Alteromonas sp. KUL49]
MANEAQIANSMAVQQLKATLEGSQSQLQALADTNSQLSESVALLEAQNLALEQQNLATLEQMKSLEGRRPADWLIAEADYLVRMAGRKVWLDDDIRTAIMLLINADKRLASLADPSLLPVRAKIAEDIQALQQANSVSVSSVALAVSGLLSQVDMLPLNVFEKPVDINAQDNELSESTADWKANLGKVWDSMVEDFFTVKTLSGPVEPVLTQETQWLIREQLRYQLMQAQAAALDYNATLFEQTLTQANSIIVSRFDNTDSQVVGYLTAVQNLASTDVTRVVPTELVSQQPLAELLDERVRQVFGEGANAL